MPRKTVNKQRNMQPPMIAVALLLAPVSSLQLPKLGKPRASLVATATASGWNKEAFNNVRVPAALLSGSSFVAINTAPLPLSSDALYVGIAKRIYLLIGIASFASTLLSVLGATIALHRASECASEDLEFEYVACQSHFFAGVMGSCLLVGLRAWISFTCPRFGNIGLSMIGSAFFLMLHMLPSSLGSIPYRYVQLLLSRVRPSSPCLILALLVGGYASFLFLQALPLMMKLDAIKPSWHICSSRPA